MVTDNARYAFHTAIKKFIKQVNSINDIHIFVFYFGLINGCCYDTNTLATYANTTPTKINSMITTEALKYNKVIHSHSYILQFESSQYIIKLLKRFSSLEACMSYTFYRYLCDVTYIPIDIIFPFMVKVLSPSVPSDKIIKQKLLSFSPKSKKLYKIPFETTILSLKDFMYNSLYVYKTSVVYGQHPYFPKKNSSHKNVLSTPNARVTLTKSCTGYKSLITWPNYPTSQTLFINRDFISPLRSIKSRQYNHSSNKIHSRSGEFYSSKLNRMVYYDSRLEYDFYKMLESDTDVLFYCEQPFSISYDFNSESLLYIPDVVIAFIDNSYALVELKALDFMATPKNICKYRALEQYCKKRNWGYLMFDLNHSLAELETRKLNPSYVEYILAFLSKKTLTLNEYNIISIPFESTHLDLIALAVQNNLDYSPEPFSLKRVNLS